MPTKEEVEKELSSLRDKHESLKANYADVVSKLNLARQLLQNTVNHLGQYRRHRHDQDFDLEKLRKESITKKKE